eukprot:TRINITY_DN4143_c0_g1_i1.p5 TRINITY_DN4143_c0_g1~~TRINITY_DN4143_c0_g1_i1.p5  ORF type:complete len:130 (+),score=4.01 TRINITY_DN4143_c0_g1_i1:607-996(+)
MGGALRWIFTHLSTPGPLNWGGKYGTAKNILFQKKSYQKFQIGSFGGSDFQYPDKNINHQNTFLNISYRNILQELTVFNVTRLQENCVQKQYFKSFKTKFHKLAEEYQSVQYFAFQATIIKSTEDRNQQ